MKKLARLVPPQMDKSWSFQMISEEPLDRYDFASCMNFPDVKAASPFLQGFDSNWAMIEFWTKDEAVIRKAAECLREHFDVELKEGDFTRADLGLE